MNSHHINMRFIRIGIGLFGFAASAHVTALSLPDVPLFTATGAPPIVMLDISRDHQLFYKAYNDFSDLDSDGKWETTYKHSFKYYGYFDNTKCYTYDGSIFSPKGDAETGNLCTSSWSGNFLNWIAMSRADVMRKVLYGGLRSTDIAGGKTVLERAALPTDAHSWTKYYKGDGTTDAPLLNKLSPFSDPSATTYDVTTTKDNTYNTTWGNLTLSSKFARVGEQVKLVSSSKTFYARVSACGDTSNPNVCNTTTFTLDFGVQTTVPKGTYKITNLSSEGVTFCNTTYDSKNESHSTTNPPLIRAAKGNFVLWAANEKRQCTWYNEDGWKATNDNRYGRGETILSGLPGAANSPDKAELGLKDGSNGPDFIARVEACVSNKLGAENCQKYPDGNYKPVGLLQKYGESPTQGSNPGIYFGLVTGSFTKNVSGGVLRKNADRALSNNSNANDDEIDPRTGVFKTKKSDGTKVEGILKTLNSLRIYGLNYADNLYLNTDKCNYQQIGIVSDGTGQNAQGYPANEGNCSSWGNPMGEAYVESLRYLAGLSKYDSFYYTSDGSTKDDKVGLSPPLIGADRRDPITEQNYCAPLNILAINASVSSYDTDQIESAFTDFKAGKTLASFTDDVGAAEGIVSAYVGKSGTTYDGMCTLKTITGLSTVTGICPEAPSLAGGYGMAGASYYAHTNRIRSTPKIGDDDKTSFKVNTFGVALATNVPRIEVSVGGKKVVIQPAYRLDYTPSFGTGTIVDFRRIEDTGTSGKYYINWEDSNQGGDYDQDAIVMLSYSVSGSKITVETYVIAGTGGHAQGAGFVISGTDQDGPHFYSGLYGFNYTDSQNITVTAADKGTRINNSGGCNNCTDQNSGDRNPRSATFNITGTAGTSLEDPLYYAAKFGGFKDLDGDGKVSSKAEWDSKDAKGQPVTNGDGKPDNFFYVNNPGALAESLSAAFAAIVNASAASAVATSSSSLRTGSMIYQATFNPKTWEGDLVAYDVNPTTLALTEKWRAASRLPAPDSRTIITALSDRTAAPFTWDSGIGAVEKTVLNAGGSDGAARLAYIRGSASRESATDFRQRKSKLGDIVDSNPIYVGVPSGQYSSENLFLSAYLNSSFTAWRNDRTTRKAVVYVGGNDGMLHAFDASPGDEGGKELLAFVPSQVYTADLASLSSQAYASAHKFFVNGSPQAADVQYSNTWKTVLASGLRKGGKGLFALDVTDPASFSQGNAAKIFLWDFLASDDTDIGYIYSQPLIAKMANNKWAVIVGNGYNSTNEKAALFILYIERSENKWSGNYKKIVVDTAGNGLAGVSGFDADADGIPETLYAGDLKGNMWKFDVSSSDDTVWSAAKLAVTCSDATADCPSPAKRQPITAAPEITRHPLNFDTPIVYFGTGKYLEIADISSTDKQSMYGIWDKAAADSVVRSTLLVQTITDGKTSRTVTDNAIDWSKHKGWVEDLPATGERVATAPYLINGALFYSTLIPSQSACDFGGNSFLMAVNYNNGGQLPWAVFDSNNDGKVDKNDTPIAGIKTGLAPGGARILRPGEDGKLGLALINPTDLGKGDPDKKTGEPEKEPLDLSGAGGSRISWRELIPR